MVERWVKSAVSPDWTVILGWGTFWIPAAAPRASATTHRAAVETTLPSWKSGVPPLPARSHRLLRRKYSPSARRERGHGHPCVHP
ncbi:hypothetical protein DBV15_11014 [Temnothorax longispinosus]|uniref:Uncharacterized protein n=1 Tax=Temnothorax longispinosus TaxID=300112 RepID=A0A4S2KQA2_9HYME|nr:hypothetical protein DBV15_11014 [Temnothorax longispinosus]